MRRRIAPAPQIGDTPKDLDFVETRLIVGYESGAMEILKLVDEEKLVVTCLEPLFGLKNQIKKYIIVSNSQAIGL